GDSTVDWQISEPPSGRSEKFEARYLWALQEGPGLSCVVGGAALDTQILRAAARLETPSMPVTGPAVPDVIRTDPMTSAVTRTFSSWKPHPVVAGARELAWRMDRFVGIHPSRAFPAELQPASFDVTPSVIVLEDGTHLFRSSPGLWPAAILDSDAQIVLRQTGSLGKGELFDYLCEHAADRLTLFCIAGDLRKEGAPIGQPLSWERTAQDVVAAIRQRPELDRIRRVVVGLSASGAVIVDREGASLIYDPRSQEGDWESSRPGHQFGSGTMVVLWLAWELGHATADGDISAAVINGIETARILHTEGYEAQPSESGIALSFPIAKIAQSIASGTSGDSGIECVSVQVDPGWRIFDSASTGNFREAAAQIASHGVNRVGREIPLETMGYWSSVDRIEIESMRSLRNIITEYLASPGRPRPLNLSVFGPPGSGKSFAIKQMASVIAPRDDRLGSLEFNLSQFASVDELPDALQQVRDLRLREYLPLVFWDEFDAALDGRELGWLVSFLAPMQDGAFTQNGITRPIGPAIFIFAGGTHATMDSFKARALELPGAKATDFLSRLRGYVDVLGPNPDGPDDRTFPLRRAILLRSVLQRSAPQLFAGDELRIDASLLAAFLDVPRYLHGSRSMEAIVEMSAISRKLTYERSSLPSVHQLSLHVDADAFMQIVQQG
ncbi:MAG: hypothetical protein KC438_03830, partial [Thermomicrobiales bacterium]|nr:hypothetical protein [Thermomicrobiales bacterium]